MRITNQMTTNKMLLNINKNTARVDTIYSQITTGKKIQFPSDDPIIASRALKFRTNLTETEQYLRNVSQGLSWQQITEQAFKNVTEITMKIRELCVQGASDTLEDTDRQKINTEVNSLFEQLGAEMNVTYAGRYVFSGYRTDKPPILTHDNPAANYDITEEFRSFNVEAAKVHSKFAGADAPEIFEVSRIKLPYTQIGLATEDASFVSFTPAAAPTTPATVTLTIDASSLPTSGGGSLVLDKGLPTEASYAYSGYVDNGNGTVTFTLTDTSLVADPGFAAAATTGGQSGSFKIVDRYGAVQETYTPTRYESPNDPGAYTPGDDEVNYIAETGELILGKNVMAKVNQFASGKIVFDYNKQGLSRGEINPEVYFDCVDVNTGRVYTVNGTTPIDDQYLEYEFGINTRIRINNLAKDSFSASLYGELRVFVQQLGSIEITSRDQLVAKYGAGGLGLTGDELNKAIDDQIEEETQKYRGVMQETISNMISILDYQGAQISKEYTELGSRMSRLTLIQSRLMEDRVSYTDLMGKNENVDYLEASMNLSQAEYVYQAALKAGASITQLTLADFIR